MRSRCRGHAIAAGIAVVLLTFATACASTARREQRWALRHVAVVDVAAGEILQDRTVVITGDRITAVAPTGPADVDDRTRTIDASGTYLIPGLWDMHAHLWDHHATPALFLANGITGIRDMGSDTTASVALRDDVDAGRRAAPRVVTAGEVLDGPRDEPAPHRITVASVAEVQPALARLERARVDFVKVYHFLSRETYLEIANQTKQRGLAVAGHLPAGVTIDDAVAAGQRSVEHLYGIREQVLRGDEAAIDEAARKSMRGGLWHTPTLAHYRSVAFRDIQEGPYKNDPHSRFLTPAMRAFWDKYMPPRTRTPEQARELAAGFARFQAAVRRMHALGVRLLAGSDNGIKYVYPGFGLHDELAELVSAGLSPLEALRTATTNAAEYLGLDTELGAIRAGMLADLVLLRGNPLDDIRQTREIVAVVANGVHLDRAALDAMLEEAASH